MRMAVIGLVTAALAVGGCGAFSRTFSPATGAYARGSEIMLATIFMHGIGHGTPVQPGSAPDEGGWDPIPSHTMVNDANAVQDRTNTTGIYGPYYAAKFWGIVP